MPPFTDRLIKHLPPKASPYRIFEAASDPGFCIQVTPAGTRTFQQQYTAAGARRYLRIGIYPDMPLSLARAKAREARAVIENGIDPQAEREKRAAQSSLSRGTVAQLADHYIGRLKGRTIIDVRQIMDKNVLPFIGERPAKEIEPDDIRDLYTASSSAVRKSTQTGFAPICMRCSR